MQKLNKYDFKTIKNIDNLNWEDYVFFENKKLIWVDVGVIKSVQKTLEKKNKEILEKDEETLEKDEEILELSKLAYYDELTGLLNRHWYKKYIEKFKWEKLDIIFCDLDNLGKINNEKWLIIWDQAITLFSSIVKKYFRNNTKRTFDLIIRYWWDEFVIISTWISKIHLNNRIKEIKENISKLNQYELWYNFSWTFSNESWVNYNEIEKTINDLHDEVKFNKKKKNK